MSYILRGGIIGTIIASLSLILLEFDFVSFILVGLPASLAFGVAIGSLTDLIFNRKKRSYKEILGQTISALTIIATLLWVFGANPNLESFITFILILIIFPVIAYWVGYLMGSLIDLFKQPPAPTP